MILELYYKNVISIIFFLVFVAWNEGVKIESVGLKSGLPYAYNGSFAHFTFNVTMTSTEVIESIVWAKDNDTGSYEWTQEGGKGVGLFSETSNKSVNAGEFIFDPVEFFHAGNYTLQITTNIGSDAAIFSFIVYYYSGFELLSSTPSHASDCLWKIRTNVRHVFPYPNISCVFTRGVNGATDLPITAISNITENITALEDGTFKFFMMANIPMKEIPMESFFECTNWIQGSKIQLMSIRDSGVSGRPCLDPPVNKNYSHKMVSGLQSCYGGYIPLTKFNYTCVEGPKKNSSKSLECRQGIWTETDDSPWPSCGQSHSGNGSSNGEQMKDSSSRVQLQGFWLSLMMFLFYSAFR